MRMPPSLAKDDDDDDDSIVASIFGSAAAATAAAGASREDPGEVLVTITMVRRGCITCSLCDCAVVAQPILLCEVGLDDNSILRSACEEMIRLAIVLGLVRNEFASSVIC